jgi:hypothetical protein
MTNTVARLSAVLLLASLAAGAWAQLRTLPADSKRGKIEHVQDMVIAIDGVPKRLAAGAQIRGPSNALLVPVAIPKGVLARYVLDGEGHVRRVWILSPTELALEPPTPQPATSAAQ